MHTDYVAGFLFNRDQTEVALIRKCKPEWQANRLNAIGGKIESGENAYDAMRREFREETSHDPIVWTEFCELHGSDPLDSWTVHFFFAVSFLADIRPNLRSVTREIVEVRTVAHTTDRLPNLRWLIPMALAAISDCDSCKCHVVVEN